MMDITEKTKLILAWLAIQLVKLAADLNQINALFVKIIFIEMEYSATKTVLMDYGKIELQ